LMLDGQRFETAEELTDHPRGKCTAVPWVQGVRPPVWETGKQYFNKLSADQQRELMGDEKYAAWKDGQFKLDDLAQMTHSKVWGDSPRVATFAELGIGA
jgi:hypothetical protein